jgi:L-seryl-tRNA(Ser) seleniumtransferase
LPLLGARVERGESVIGGGSTPEQAIATWLIVIERKDVIGAERRLRTSDPPVIARIEDGRLLVDLRTVLAEEEAELARALRELR